jgi:hypothetical protein
LILPFSTWNCMCELSNCLAFVSAGFIKISIINVTAVNKELTE